MFSINSLQTNRPDDSQLNAIADNLGGYIPFPIEIALCVRWLAVRQRHKAMTPRDRVNLTMTDHLDLVADAWATISTLDLASISSLGRKFNLISVGTARGGPSLQDLPTVLGQAKVGALVIWSTEENDYYPMAAYRSGGSFRGLGPDTLSLYTAELGEFAPIKIRNIQSRPKNAICGYPDPIVQCRAVLMRSSEQVASAETDADDADASLVAQASQPSTEGRHVRFAEHVEMAEFRKNAPVVVGFRRKVLDF